MAIRRSGFTLMEIMVVIIVISVLASVGGPMVNTITEQGKTSATKAKIDNLRKAILAYQGDVGRLPHTGKARCSSYIDAYNADAILNNEDADKNVLITDDVFDFNVKRYKRKWNGPYMDSEPYDFMQDSWGNRIQYVAEGKSVFGDVNMDGSVDDADYEYLCMYLNGDIEIAKGDEILADVDFDGDITENDAKTLLYNIENYIYA